MNDAMPEEVIEKLSRGEKKDYKNSKILYFRHETDMPPTPQEVMKVLKEKKKGLLVSTNTSLYKVGLTGKISDRGLYAKNLRKQISNTEVSSWGPKKWRGWEKQLAESNWIVYGREPLRKDQKTRKPKKKPPKPPEPGGEGKKVNSLEDLVREGVKKVERKSGKRRGSTYIWGYVLKNADKIGVDGILDVASPKNGPSMDPRETEGDYFCINPDAALKNYALQRRFGIDDITDELLQRLHALKIDARDSEAINKAMGKEGVRDGIYAVKGAIGLVFFYSMKEWLGVDPMKGETGGFPSEKNNQAYKNMADIWAESIGKTNVDKFIMTDKVKSDNDFYKKYLPDGKDKVYMGTSNGLSESLYKYFKSKLERGSWDVGEFTFQLSSSEYSVVFFGERRGRKKMGRSDADRQEEKPPESAGEDKKPMEPPKRKQIKGIKALIYDGKIYENPSTNEEGNFILPGKIRKKELNPRRHKKIIMDENVLRNLRAQWTNAKEESVGALIGRRKGAAIEVKGIQSLKLPEMKEEDRGLEYKISDALGGKGGTLSHEKVLRYFRKSNERIGTYHSHPSMDPARWNDKREWKELAEKGNARVHMVIVGSNPVPKLSEYGGIIPYYVNDQNEVKKAYILVTEAINTKKHVSKKEGSGYAKTNKNSSGATTEKEVTGRRKDRIRTALENQRKMGRSMEEAIEETKENFLDAGPELIKTKAEEVYSLSSSDGEKMRCMNCGIDVSVEAENCPNCGEPLGGMREQQEKVIAYTCPYCGDKDVEEEEDCPSCGRRVKKLLEEELEGLKDEFNGYRSKLEKLKKEFKGSKGNTVRELSNLERRANKLAKEVNSFQSNEVLELSDFIYSDSHLYRSFESFANDVGNFLQEVSDFCFEVMRAKEGVEENK